ncbi:MAG: ABC transporter ATP-binding protein [Treponema sp.]|jgi:ABC-type nitrate/sulfonate/bicarbonate transport system ATPase subunit|nr:ABC transporter ATP-binding protein [Treponema sp.]
MIKSPIGFNHRSPRGAAGKNAGKAENAGAALFYCRDILKTYEGEPVVEGVNLDLPGGGLVSLVGPSGTGKTTLFNVLAGVDRPDRGRIVLGGEDITGVSGRVSYMMQKDLLLEYRTVLDNVILPLLVRGGKKREAREYGASFFPPFGLAGYEHKYPRQLSGGMRQRAALLRTCLQSDGTPPAAPDGKGRSTPVILLDEPFSALDALTRRTMQDWFQGIAAGGQSPLGNRLSAIFITHDVEEAVILSDRVYVLEGRPGRITAAFDVKAPRPRSRDFSLGPGFAALKGEILTAIGV